MIQKALSHAPQIQQQMTSFDARLSAIEKTMRSSASPSTGPREEASASRPMGFATDGKELQVAREPSTFHPTHRRKSEPAASPSTPPSRQVRFHD
eukprot:1581737-Amphidinium_carterae.1